MLPRLRDGAARAARLALAAAALALPAFGSEADLVVIADTDNPELGRQIRAEVAYAGFSAVGGAQRDGDAPARIQILSAQRVQLSVQRASDQVRFEQTLERRPAEGDSFALRVVEVLRARLVDVGWTLPDPASPPAPSEPDGATVSRVPEPARANEAREDSEPLAANEAIPTDEQVGAETSAPATAAFAGTAPNPRLWLGAGATGSWSFGGLGVTPHAALSLRGELGRDWGATLTAQLPFGKTELEGAEGEANVGWSTFSAALDHGLPLPEPWLGGAGLGAGVFVLDASGDGRTDFSGQHERLWCGAAFVTLSFGRELESWLRLRATATGGATAPRPVLLFDGREVASLGRGFASFGLALELSWPAPNEAGP
jgi:hypothetical protein